MIINLNMLRNDKNYFYLQKDEDEVHIGHILVCRFENNFTFSDRRVGEITM